LIRLANRHPRVNILQPGPGVGGHCIAVDPWFIVSSSPAEARLIRTAREVNDSKPEWVLEKVRAAIGAHLMENPSKTASGVTVAVYGLAFKPDIDDLRESPALEIAKALTSTHPGLILVIEPNISELPACLQSTNVTLKQGDIHADVHVLLVDHKPFKNEPKPDGIIVDTRGVWN